MMRILIADDHELVRDVLRSYLEAESEFEVQTVADLPEALACNERDGPFDLILLDYAMPGMDGFAGLETAVKKAGDRPVALMSGLAPSGVSEKVLACGAAGYLPKTLPARSVVNAIRFMAAGEIYMPVEFLRPASATPEQESILSPREREVLGGLCKGFSNKEIALDLDLREPTIKLHVKALCRKLSARNRTHAAMIARERCLI
jgi:DNA-binding NarL/FixJ family response regulator